MREPKGTTGRLTVQFFRRFFENDVVGGAGDTVTTVVRALAIVAAPGLMVAFFMQNEYPARSAWGRVEDHYLFVLLSLLVMAGVTLFEWEMLFPDRLDFLILSPLPVRAWQMLAAKAMALAGFLLLFLVGCNALGLVMLPLVSRSGWLFPLAQVLAVGMAGLFGALMVLGLGGVLLCVLSPRAFRVVSPVLRTVAVAALAMLLLEYVRFGDQMEVLLRSGNRVVEWVPTFWFVGVWERVLHGGAAPAFAGGMAWRAMEGTGLAAAVVAATYPMAWARMRRMAVEDATSERRPPSRWLRTVVNQVVRRPAERAVFAFIGQTVARSSRYQVYLAMYCGTGLALAVSCATGVRAQSGGATLVLSRFGMHAVMPLLLFWTVAGLRMGFGLPVNLPARWVFRTSGAALRECVAGVRRWAMLCGLLVGAVVLGVLYCLGWTGRELVVQAGFGVCLLVLLVEGFFFAQNSVPFSRPRQPGKTSLPLLLTLYVGVLPPFLFGMVLAEQGTERRLGNLGWPLLGVALLLLVLRWLQERSLTWMEEGEEPEGEFQLLGLS